MLHKVSRVFERDGVSHAPSAGKTISVVRGSLRVNTNTAKVEQDTRKGVVDQVKLATAWPAPIFRRFLSSWSFLI